MNDLYKIKESWASRAKVDKVKYEELYKKSISNNEDFWREEGKRVDWFESYTKIKNVTYSKEEVNIKWYYDGKINASYNCIDRHVKKIRTRLQ